MTAAVAAESIFLVHEAQVDDIPTPGSVRVPRVQKVPSPMASVGCVLDSAWWGESFCMRKAAATSELREADAKA